MSNVAEVEERGGTVEGDSVGERKQGAPSVNWRFPLKGS